MKIRPAISADLDTLVALGRRMHAESPRFSMLGFDETKVRALLLNAITDDRYLLIVAEREDGEVIGGFAGFMAPHWFSQDYVASDIGLFVDPDRRGGIVAARLLKDYVAWAQARGAKQINAGISTGVMVEQTAQMYRLLGLKQFGYLFEV
jgi:GNAT superfamily N-acetyltransferase